MYRRAAGLITQGGNHQTATVEGGAQYGFVTANDVVCPVPAWPWMPVRLCKGRSHLVTREEGKPLCLVSQVCVWCLDKKSIGPKNPAETMRKGYLASLVLTAVVPNARVRPQHPFPRTVAGTKTPMPC